MKKAVIVAAGLSSRLYPLTLEKPKGLLEIEGSTLLERSIASLRNVGVEHIAIVLGYKLELMKNRLSDQVELCISNPFYKHCNNMGSLWFARDFVGDDPFLYLHGDIAYEPEILSEGVEHFCKTDGNDILLTDFGPTDEEAMKVLVDEDNHLIESSKDIPLDEAQGEWLGIAMIHDSQNLFFEIERLLYDDQHNVYDTRAFSNLAKSGRKFLCQPINGRKWIEVDTKEDFDRAKELFNG